MIIPLVTEKGFNNCRVKNKLIKFHRVFVNKFAYVLSRVDTRVVLRDPRAQLKIMNNQKTFIGAAAETNKH